MGPLGAKNKQETISKFEIQERVMRGWQPPEGVLYVWEHWSDVARINVETGRPVTHDELWPTVQRLAEVFESDFRVVRVTTTTTVVCEELGSTLED